ncbi:hypothetical protein UFOVP273_101 [uncultured Caudovirales phage]|uniref:Uncharacterized protein n=1 Tax=uncultured Caudovirales phage TaxID=2100421 RepID=A0A6J5LLU4_9CAUD|nr:hypothetical protein UFOVP273_101 [uncultured Caudovirales phage]
MYLDNPDVKEKIFVFSEAELLYQNASVFYSEEEWLDFLETFMDIETGILKRQFHDEEPHFFPAIMIESPYIGKTEDGRPFVSNVFLYPKEIEPHIAHEEDSLGAC